MTRVLAFVIVGVILSAVNALYVRAVYYRFFASKPPSTIASFHIAGREDKGDRLSVSLAILLQARLSKLRTELSEGFGGHEVLGSVDSAALPKELKSNLDNIQFNLKVAGVELSGAIGFFARLFDVSRSLKPVVQFSTDTALVACPTTTGRTVWVKAKDDPAEIVDAVAYAFVQAEMARSTEPLEALDWTEFRQLLDLAVEFRTAVRREAAGRRDPGVFGGLVARALPLHRKLKCWRNLTDFCADVGRRAGNESAMRELFESRLECARTEDDREEVRRLLSELGPKAGQHEVLVQVRADALDSQRERPIRIGIFGILPAAIEKKHRDFVEELASTEPGAEEDVRKGRFRHVRFAVDVGMMLIRQVTPTATVVVTAPRDSRGFETAEGAEDGLQRLIDEGNLDVLLFARPNLNGDAQKRMIEAAVSAGIVVVVPSEDKKALPGLPARGKNLLYIQPVDRNGALLPRHRTDPDAVGVPGGWPERSPEHNGQVTYVMSSEGYIAAALVARIASRMPIERRGAIADAVFETSRISETLPKGLKGPKIVRVLDALRKLGPAPPP